FGMNFEYMPELKWRYGYFIALGVMSTIAISLALLFKRRGWL
ncbi:MAG: magnesium transporter, partial [Pseudoalteromonas tetraodonis]